MAMMAMTTSSSISVKAERFRRDMGHDLLPGTEQGSRATTRTIRGEGTPDRGVAQVADHPASYFPGSPGVKLIPSQCHGSWAPKRRRNGRLSVLAARRVPS